jgi:hypothetical protein
LLCIPILLDASEATIERSALAGSANPCLDMGYGVPRHHALHASARWHGKWDGIAFFQFLVDLHLW